MNSSARTRRITALTEHELSLQSIRTYPNKRFCTLTRRWLASIAPVKPNS